jgi:hypothetical protein
MRKSLWIVPAAFLFASIGVPTAHADAITQWTLSNVVFSDGATITGSFDFDATTDTYSAVAITLNDGSFTYLYGNANVLFGSPTLIQATTTGKLDGSPEVSLEFADSLATTSLTTVPILDTEALIGLGGDFTFFKNVTPGGTPHAYAGDDILTSGEITSAVSTPEPGSLALTLFGLVLLGVTILVKRKRKAQGLTQTT